MRDRLLKAGVDAGEAVDYRGAGTVEFLYDGGENVYFMEMNTRLQVEHPVTEMITGVDLVEWQLRVAAGEPIPVGQDAITETGHAFESRLYAENPAQNFAPSIGTLTKLDLPHANARIDSGVVEGQSITPFYDPMIAKIITHGDTREEALASMRAALTQTRVAGLETNTGFLHALASDDDFVAGDVSTRYIEDHEAALFAEPAPSARERAIAAAVLARHFDAARTRSTDPWSTLTGFRLNKPAKAVYWTVEGGAPAIVRLHRMSESGLEMEIDPGATAAGRRAGDRVAAPRRIAFNVTPEGEALRIEMDGVAARAHTAPHANGVRVFIDGRAHDVAFPDPLAGEASGHSAEGSLTAPMPGVVTLLSAEPGAKVEAGAPLLVMEAMKMEHAIKAPHDGVVKAFRFKPGDQVKEGDLLVAFEETE